MRHRLALPASLSRARQEIGVRSYLHTRVNLGLLWYMPVLSGPSRSNSGTLCVTGDPGDPASARDPTRDPGIRSRHLTIFTSSAGKQKSSRAGGGGLISYAYTRVSGVSGSWLRSGCFCPVGAGWLNVFKSFRPRHTGIPGIPGYTRGPPIHAGVLRLRSAQLYFKGTLKSVVGFTSAIATVTYRISVFRKSLGASGGAKWPSPQVLQVGPQR